MHFEIWMAATANNQPPAHPDENRGPEWNRLNKTLDTDFRRYERI